MLYTWVDELVQGLVDPWVEGELDGCQLTWQKPLEMSKVDYYQHFSFPLYSDEEFSQVLAILKVWMCVSVQGEGEERVEFKKFPYSLYGESLYSLDQLTPKQLQVELTRC